MARERLQFLLEFLRKGTGVRDATKDLNGLQKTTKRTGDSMKSFNAGLEVAKNSLGAVAAAGFAAKKIFEFGEFGAQVTQTGESFDLLVRKVGAAPDLLEQLSAAAKGTVSDMQLMSSTSTLLAGAQGELATKLAGATPQLLEIAKAAQKLNPSLGDTTFLYESLATGIKRASPLILDNLGLTIKVGDANEKFAASLGKSVNELTAEEQKMALLNATLEAGGILIDQVGGNTDSATDAFARLKVTTTELGQAFAQKLAPGLADAAEAATLLLTWNQQIEEALRTNKQTALDTAVSYDEYREGLEKAAIAADMMVDEQGRLIKVYHTGFGEVTNIIDANYVMTRSLYDARQATDEQGRALDALNMVYVPAIENTEELAGGINDLSNSFRSQRRASQRAKDSFLDVNVELVRLEGGAALSAERMAELAEVTDDTAPAFARFAGATGGLTDALRDLGVTALPDTITEIDRWIENLTAATVENFVYQDSVRAITAAYQSGQITRNEAIQALQLLKQEAESGIPAFDGLAGSVRDYGAAVGVATGVTGNLSAALAALPHEKQITLTVVEQRRFVEEINAPSGPAGAAPPATPPPAPGGGAPGGVTGPDGNAPQIVISPGAVNVHAAPGQDATAIAQAVAVQLGAMTRAARTSGARTIGL